MLPIEKVVLLFIIFYYRKVYNHYCNKSIILQVCSDEGGSCTTFVLCSVIWLKVELMRFSCIYFSYATFVVQVPFLFCFYLRLSKCFGFMLLQNEWRAIGVQQSRGWVHYAIHRPEPHIMLFRRPLNYQQQQENQAQQSMLVKWMNTSFANPKVGIQCYIDFYFVGIWVILWRPNRWNSLFVENLNVVSFYLNVLWTWCFFDLCWCTSRVLLWASWII